MTQRPVFLMVAGLSPQIVTETLYAFHLQAPETLQGAELHLLTTREGAQRAELTLLTGDDAKLPKLIVDHGLPAIDFSSRHIHVIADAQGQPLDDIRSPADNAAAADFITRMVREFTADPAVALHVSLAGGRKTMGFYIGYALSLYGREQDTLSHVLVSERFESHPAFFYPTPRAHIIHTRDGKPLDAQRAEITLARIPFVRLRDELPEDALLQQVGFSSAVERLNAAIQPPRLVVHTLQPRLWCNAIEVRLEPMEWVLYLWFSERCRLGEPPLEPPVEGHPDLEQGQALLALIRRFELEDVLTTRSLDALASGLDLNVLRSRRSALHRKLRQRLGRRLAERFMILNVKRSGHRSGSYALQLTPDQISLTAAEQSSRSAAE